MGDGQRVKFFCSFRIIASHDLVRDNQETGLDADDEMKALVTPDALFPLLEMGQWLWLSAATAGSLFPCFGQEHRLQKGLQELTSWQGWQGLKSLVLGDQVGWVPGLEAVVPISQSARIF